MAAMLSLSRKEKYRSSRCILCEGDLPLTEEHVFPIGCGGGLIADILCEACNAHFGQNIDQPYLAQHPIQLARFINKTKGRRDSYPNPMKGPYKISGPMGPQKIQIDDNLKPHTLPYVHIDTTADIPELKMVVAAKDREKIPEIIRSKLERFFGSAPGLRLGWSIEEQEKYIQKTTEASLASPVIETPVEPLNQTFSIDLRTLFLEAVKVCFEMACIEWGDAFTYSPDGEKFRSLLKQAHRGEIQSIPKFEEMLKAFNAAHIPLDCALVNNLKARIDGNFSDHHVALLTGENIFVSMFGMPYLFGNLYNPLEKGAIYVNNALNSEVGYMELPSIRKTKSGDIPI